MYKSVLFMYNLSQFPEDIEDQTKLRMKLKLPDTVPDPVSISAVVKRLHNIVTSRYVGVASFIPLKTPAQYFEKLSKTLAFINEGYEGQQEEKIFRLGKEQQAVFNSGLENYSNFGGHGSGEIIKIHNVFIGNWKLSCAYWYTE
jgi:hypothetical protein